MLKNLKKSEIALFFISYLILILTYVIFKTGILEFLASVFLLSGVILNTKGNRFLFVFSGIGGLIYSYVAYENKLYSEVIINIIYIIPIQIWGFIKWKKDNDKYLKLQIKSLEKRHFFYISIFLIALTLVYGYILLTINNALPFVSAFATGCYILGVTFAANRIKQQYIFWILNNLCLIIMWVYTLKQSTMQLPILILNIIFIALNIKGLKNWNDMYKRQK